MKKGIYFSLLFLLFTSFVNSQEIDTLSTKTYKELSDLINKTYNLDKEITADLLSYYINKAKEEDNYKEEFNGLGKLIEIKIQYRQFNDFEAEEKQFINLANVNNYDKSLMHRLYFHANSYFYQGLFGKAVETYYKSLAIAEKLKDTAFKHLNLKQIGYLKYFTGNLDESVSLQKQAIYLLDDSGNKLDSLFTSQKKRMKFEAYELLTRTYLFAEQQDSARIYNDKAFQLKIEKEDSCYLKVFTRQKAQIYVLDKAYDKAKIYLSKVKDYCYIPKSIDDFYLASEYGKIHLELKEYNKAVEVLNEGLENFNLDGQEAFASDYLKLLAKAYMHQGNVEKSNLYFEKFVTASEDYGKIKDTVVARIKSQEISAFQNELNTIKTEKNHLKYLALGASLIILVLLFFLLKFYKTKKKNELKFQDLFEKVNTSSKKADIVDTKDAILEESTSSDVNEETKQQILEGLEKLETQEYFLKQDCNSYNVAKKIKTNTSYLSKVINSHYQKNFNTYINDLRINYAVVRLKNDSRFRSFSIQSIAEELGYKSADSFTKYFKQHTGLNPSFYIKQLNNLA